MKANIEIKRQIGRNYTLRIQTDEGTMGSNLIPLSKDDARILSKTLGIKIKDAKCTKEELSCECDCHAFVGGSGKACPQCIKEKCGLCVNHDPEDVQ